MITTLSHPLVKKARALKERHGRSRHGLYPIEGVRLVEEALDRGCTPALVLYHEPLLQTTERGSVLLQRLEGLSCAGGPASRDVLAGVCDTVHPAGVMAALALPPDRLEPALPLHNGLSVVLGQVQDPGNAGSILRTAAAAGLDGVIAMTGTVDLYAPKVVRAGMGAHLRLPLRVGQEWRSISPWLATQAQVVVADGRATRTIYDVEWQLPVALVLGNEAHGYTPTSAEIGASPNIVPVRIPMPGGIESLNVAAAAAVLIYEALRRHPGR